MINLELFCKGKAVKNSQKDIFKKTDCSIKWRGVFLSFIFVFFLKVSIYNNNNNSLHLYSAFLGTQSALHGRGVSPQPPPG